MRVTINAEVDTDLPPAAIRDALLDFTERRLEVWSQTLDPSTYAAHTIGESTAEVTEGSRIPKVWSRELYDWSDPNRITWTTLESNFCKPGSRIEMRLTPTDGGGTRLGVTWDRTPSNLRGFLYLLPIKLGGGRLLGWATRQALTAVAKT